jgi:hypothetical protein
LLRIYGDPRAVAGTSSEFRDITSGTAGTFSTLKGWVFVTGMGSNFGLAGKYGHHRSRDFEAASDGTAKRPANQSGRYSLGTDCVRRKWPENHSQRQRLICAPLPGFDADPPRSV